MSTVIEDPGIPLVGRNGGNHMYTMDSRDSSGDSTPVMTSLETKKQERKFDNVGYRLARRKELFQKRKVICDFALIFAMVGIVLMVVETELFMAKVYANGKADVGSILVKLAISISTVIMLGFVVWYHILDIKLYMVDNSLEDWRLALTPTRLYKMLLELLIYAIHPIPGNYEFTWTTLNAESGKISRVPVPVDVIFSIPMFLRFFLLCRVMMLHSKLFTDASSQSLGALNRIHFNFRFIFKSMMTLYPEYVLTVLMVTGFIIASWALRACEMYHDEVHANFFNSMWLISITFLSVGYGDIVPNSYCGRAIAVMTGIFGAGCTALVVAVLARKLELSRAEKFVHNFVIDVELDKRYKIAAANIVKAGWFVYKNRKHGKFYQARRYQRRLLHAIHSIREVKQEQRRLLDSGVTLIEMAKSQSNICENICKMDVRQEGLDRKVNMMESRLGQIEEKLDSLCQLISRSSC